MAFQEKHLAQLRPANTTAASLYSVAASTTAIAKSLVICNTSGAKATFRVFFDDNGTTYDETTALFWDHPIAANTTVQIDTYWPSSDSTGNYGVKTSVADALTFSLFGVEIS